MADLVGRDEEMAVVQRLVDRATAGSFGACVLRGHPGTGKSALLGAARALAAGDRLRIVDVRGRDTHRDEEGAALGAALSLASTPSPARSLTYALERACRDAPAMLLLVDDLQWVDDASIAALRDVLASRPRGLAAVVAARRSVPEEAARLVYECERDGGEILDLAPLSPEAVRRLIENELGVALADSALGVFERAEGNPLLARSLLAVLRRSGALVVGAGVAAVHLQPDAELPTPPVVETLLSLLPPATRHLVRTLAVLDREVTISELASAVDADEGVVAHDLEPAIAEGVVVVEPGGVRCGHDLLREAAAAEVPHDVRHRAHARISRRAGIPRESAARHAAAAICPQQPFSWVSADEALHRAIQVRSSPTLAARLLDVIAAAAPDEATREVASAHRAWALAQLAQPDHALALLEALRGSDPRVRIATAEARGVALANLGRAGDGVAALREAVALDVELRVLAPPARAQLEAGLARQLALAPDPEDGADVAARAEAAAVEAGDELATAAARWSVARLAVRRGRTEEARPALQRLVAAARAGDAASIALDPHFDLVLLQARSGELADAAVTAAAAVEVNLAAGRPHRGVLFRTLQVRLALHLGGWADARAVIDEAEIARRHFSDASVLTGGLGAVAAAFHALRGDMRAAAICLRAYVEDTPRRGPTAADAASAATALLSEDAGSVRAAARAFVDTDAELGTSASLAPHLIAACLRSRQERSAAAVAAAAPSSWCDALCARDGETLIAVARRLEALGHRADAAFAWSHAALFGRGLPSNTLLGALRRAESALSTLGATPELRRVRRRLRSLGHTSGPSGASASPTLALSPMERTVAEQVAAGGTNASIAAMLFLSPRTVESHVANARRKLGARNRSELAALWRSRAASTARMDD